ncbi:MAG: ABC transporter substrate-binding protein [Deltaproteobacteria bacterium]|nr:ABC transporter substrate-binding protein [Deltaproteobacteria bacterium]MBW2120263.1 ABC transporter substrate-binding protein [Deltaproteobacteria bacterium]
MKKILAISLIVLFFASAGWAADTIKIGSLTALTGGLAPFGPPIDYGAQLAAAQINGAGGIFGKMVEIVTRDTATAPAVGRDAATKLVEIDKVPAVVGALSSGVTLAASSVTIANGVVLISPASTSPQLTELKDNDFVFRTCPSDALQGVIQGAVAANQGYKTASILFVNNAYGKGLAEAFARAFEKKGGKIVGMVPYEEGKPSYRGEVESAIRRNPDVLNVIAYPVDGNKQLVEAVELGYKGGYIFPDGMKGDAVSGGPAKDYINGSVGTAPGALEVAEAALFENDYKAFLAQQGLSPKEVSNAVTIPFRMQAYDATVLIALAIARTRRGFLKMPLKEQGKAIRDNLRRVANAPGTHIKYNQFAKAFDLLAKGREVNYQGVSGPITFDKRGDVKEAAIEIWMVRNGKTVPIWTVPVK